MNRFSVSNATLQAQTSRQISQEDSREHHFVQAIDNQRMNWAKVKRQWTKRLQEPTMHLGVFTQKLLKNCDHNPGGKTTLKLMQFSCYRSNALLMSIYANGLYLP
jgi:hypothetical protein